MKFLSKKNLNFLFNNHDEDLSIGSYNTIPFNHELLFLDYTKKNVKKRKIVLDIKKGITKTEKKNSLKRDKNNTILQQYFNIMIKNGNKNTLFKNFDQAIEMFFFILNGEDENFNNYRNYSSLNFLVNNLVEYNDFSYLLEIFLPKYFSLFDIKTIKNNKKKRSLKKYSHEVVYISENKRLKNLLKIINTYSENFKNYELWDRLFWTFIKLILNDGSKKSYLLNRRSYIYKKSIKFFINNKNK